MTDDLGVKPPIRWSFSQWSTYNTCPAKWKYGSVMKLPRKPPGVAASRGLMIHDSVEKYIHSGPIADHSILHPAVHQKYIPILDEFRMHPNGDMHTEKKLAFDSEWYLCSPVSKHAACIAILDAARYTKSDYGKPGILHIGEWKSGKPKDDHVDQRKLYAMFGMKAFLADRVEVTTYYLEDTEKPQRITLASIEGYEKLKALWANRIDTMMRDQICAPRPSWTCRFCDFSKAEGGPCQFGG
jgi:hypothetical protein